MQLQEKQLKIINITTDGKQVIDGPFLFDNMNEKGMPLDVQLIQLDLLTGSQFAVDWIGFIDRALDCNWLVYQIHDRIQNSLIESDLFDKDYIAEVMNRFRIHICRNVEGFKQFITEPS